MPDLPPTPIASKPGIKRDGTMLDGEFYVDGQWCRFDRGKPRKMGGYRAINNYLSGIGRTLHEYTRNRLTYVHVGSANAVERFFIDGSMSTSTISDRTPASGFTADSENLWQFDALTNLAGDLKLIAQVAPNLDCICNSAGGELFTGDFFATTALTPVPALNLPADYSATGGIFSLAPYAVVLGNAGFIMWSVPYAPDDFVGSGAGYATITSQKLIKGMHLRGGSATNPSALLWSVDSLIQMSYIGGTETFSFNTISASISVLSPSSIIEMDGIYYWLGSDRFFTFNGVVRDLPNDLNRDFLFDNINYAYRQKVFAMAVPRWGEIWWCFPKGESTEPNHAIILNVRDGTWYDTEIPEDGRGAGIYPSVFRRPLMAGVEPVTSSVTAVTVSDQGTGYVVGDVLTISGGVGSVPAQVVVDTVDGSGGLTAITLSNAGSYTVEPDTPADVTGGTGTGATINLTLGSTYKFWVHETGTDKLDGQDQYPIQSYFETSDVSLPAASQGVTQTSVVYIEPDFVQSGDMTVTISGQANARAPIVDGDPMTFVDNATTPDQEVVFLKDQRRMLRFRFESNTLGGNYLMGVPLAHLRPGDGTMLA